MIGTFGRGAWVLDLAPIRKSTTEPLFLYPLREITLDPFPWDSVPGDRRGRPTAHFCLVSDTGGAATITVTNASGSVIRQWQAILLRGANTLTWDLQTKLKTDISAGIYQIAVKLGMRYTSVFFKVYRSKK